MSNKWASNEYQMSKVINEFQMSNKWGINEYQMSIKWVSLMAKWDMRDSYVHIFIQVYTYIS